MDPDILLVDEVLSVGDWAFQRKCTEKMNSVIQGGSAVIFVSHNLRAVSTLCHRGILLDHGQIVKSGTANEVIQHYLDRAAAADGAPDADKEIQVSRVEIESDRGESIQFNPGEKIRVRIEVSARKKFEGLAVAINFTTTIFTKSFPPRPSAWAIPPFPSSRERDKRAGFRADAASGARHVLSRRADQAIQHQQDVRQDLSRSHDFHRQRKGRARGGESLPRAGRDRAKRAMNPASSQSPSERLDLSVIVATRNRSAILRETLASLKRLDTEGLRWELIVVDNGSTDDTAQILEQARQRLPLSILREERLGQNYARNRGLENARGELLIFSDDDILFPANWLREYLEASRRWPECGIFGGPIEPVFPEGVPVWIREHPQAGFVFGRFHPERSEGLSITEPRRSGGITRCARQSCKACGLTKPSGRAWDRISPWEARRNCCEGY